MSDVSLAQVNQLTLGKNHLIAGSPASDIPALVEHVCGLHATMPTTPYPALFARMENFARADLDKELFDAKTLGKLRSVRRTVYVLTNRMIPIFFAATKKLSELRPPERNRYLGVSEAEYEKAAAKVLRLVENEALPVREIKARMGGSANYSAIVNLMCDQGMLIRWAPEKSWRSNTHTYRSFAASFPDVDLAEYHETTARNLLVKQYVAAFGPVTLTDISWWTGLKKAEISAAVDTLESEISRISISGLNGEHILLDSDLDAVKAASEFKAGRVKLLPALDPYLMGYKDRRRYLDEKDTVFVFDRSGNLTATILANGRICGVWDIDEKQGVVKVHFLRKVSKADVEAAHAEARRVGEFMTGKTIGVAECLAMTPIPERPAGAYMAPLKDR